MTKDRKLRPFLSAAFIMLLAMAFLTAGAMAATPPKAHPKQVNNVTITDVSIQAKAASVAFVPNKVTVALGKANKVAVRITNNTKVLQTITAVKKGEATLKPGSSVILVFNLQQANVYTLKPDTQATLAITVTK